MSNYVRACELCGEPFEGASRMKLSLMAEKGAGVFSTAGWAMYLCGTCASKAATELKEKACR